MISAFFLSQFVLFETEIASCDDKLAASSLAYWNG